MVFVNVVCSVDFHCQCYDCLWTEDATNDRSRFRFSFVSIERKQRRDTTASDFISVNLDDNSDLDLVL